MGCAFLELILGFIVEFEVAGIAVLGLVELTLVIGLLEARLHELGRTRAGAVRELPRKLIENEKQTE